MHEVAQLDVTDLDRGCCRGGWERMGELGSEREGISTVRVELGGEQELTLFEVWGPQRKMSRWPCRNGKWGKWGIRAVVQIYM